MCVCVPVSVCVCVFDLALCSSLRTVIEKSSEDQLVFLLTVSESVVNLRYGQPHSGQTDDQTGGQSSGQPLSVSFSTRGRITVDRWTHLALQVRPETSHSNDNSYPASHPDPDPD